MESIFFFKEKSFIKKYFVFALKINFSIWITSKSVEITWNMVLFVF